MDNVSDSNHGSNLLRLLVLHRLTFVAVCEQANLHRHTVDLGEHELEGVHLPLDQVVFGQLWQNSDDLHGLLQLSAYQRDRVQARQLLRFRHDFRVVHPQVPLRHVETYPVELHHQPHAQEALNDELCRGSGVILVDLLEF